MAARPQTQEVVNARVALAKARLAAIAHDIDHRPGLTGRAVGFLRTKPWQGVAVALLAGVALGATRRTALPVAPVAARMLGQSAVTVAKDVGAFATRHRRQRSKPTHERTRR